MKLKSTVQRIAALFRELFRHTYLVIPTHFIILSAAEVGRSARRRYTPKSDLKISSIFIVKKLEH